MPFDFDRRWKCLVAVLVLTVSLACEGPDWGGAGRPIAFPHRVWLGNTVVMVVGTNAFPVFADEDEFDLSVDNVRIRLVDGGGNQSSLITPRGVFEVPASLSGKFVTLPGMQGASVTLAAFDTPTVAWPGFAGTGLVLAKVVRPNGSGGWAADSAYSNQIYIEGSGGNPTDFSNYNEIEFFGPRPMLRLRPRYELGPDEGFDPEWSTDIGSIEFVVTYDPTRVTSPEAFVSGDAANGFAMAGPPTTVGALESSRVIVVDPTGFDFAFEGCVDDTNNVDCYSGQGTFVDVTFTKQSSNFTPGDVVFDEGDFTISELKVYDVDGNPLPPDSSGALPDAEYLHRHVVNNVAE